MATADRRVSGAIAFAGNGANRPLHQDRQILCASDLALEQATQDAVLARARRYLHGWGVVAGFIPEVAEPNTLFMGPGYGVAPLGDELFLPELGIAAAGGRGSGPVLRPRSDRLRGDRSGRARSGPGGGGRCHGDGLADRASRQSRCGAAAGRAGGLRPSSGEPAALSPLRRG